MSGKQARKGSVLTFPPEEALKQFLDPPIPARGRDGEELDPPDWPVEVTPVKEAVWVLRTAGASDHVPLVQSLRDGGIPVVPTCRR